MNAEEMIEIGTVFNSAFTHVLNNTLGSTKDKVQLWTTNHVLRNKPWMMLTTNGIEVMQEAVFVDSEIADFIMELNFTFSTYWAASAEKYSALANVLGLACGVQVEGKVPKAVVERTVAPNKTVPILEGNRWMMILLLMIAFVEPVGTETPPRPKAAQETANGNT